MENQFYTVVDYYVDNKKVKTISMERLENIVNPKLFWNKYKESLKNQRVIFVEIDGKIINRCIDYDFAVHYLVEYK